MAIQREGAQRVFATFGKVFDETESVFEARRQARAEHALYLAQNPEVSERVDKITALLWVLEGGEGAAAECYMRGFQFGTAHHNQCVYEVKMGRDGGPAAATTPAARREAYLASRVSRPPAAAAGLEQGEKVYDRSECIGPVIMGKCHGSILPNKAYHPTCHGTWLNGACTGPMF